MNATINTSRKQLITALDAVEHIIPSKSPRPWRQHARLTINGSVSLAGYNMGVDASQHWKESLSCEHNGEADVPIHPKKMLQIAKKLKDDFVALEITDDKATLRAASAEFSFPTMDTSEDGVNGYDYPPVPEIDEKEHVFCIKASDLVDAFAETEYATSNIRLQNIHLEIEGEKATFVATDGSRLVWTTKPITNNLAFDTTERPQSILINPTTLNAIKNRNPSGTLVVTISKDLITIEGEAFKSTSGRPQGRFPRWMDVIPRCNNSITLDTKKLKESLESLLLISDDKNSLSGTLIVISNNLKIVATKNESTATSQLPLQNQHEDVTIGNFSVPYILDFLKTVASKTVTMEFTDDPQVDPLKLSAECNLNYILMPLNKRGTP